MNNRPAYGGDACGEYLIVDDNNSHDGEGPKYAVLRKGNNSWSVLEVDEGFRCEDKVLQDMIDKFVLHGSYTFIHD